MLNQDIFYFASIRKITAAFGALFSNINIARYSELGGQGTITKIIKVPFAGSERQKWLDLIQENVHPAPAYTEEQNKKTRVRTSLPRMSFELTSLQYDPLRKLQTVGATIRKSDDVHRVLKQLNPVPCDIGYDVNIAVKNIDDGLQIIEQILPNFTPSWTMNIKDIPELGINRDVFVIFAGITKQDTYEGNFEEERVINWTLSFVVKGYVYPAIKGAGIIKTVIDNISQQKDLSHTDAIVHVEVNPPSANIDENWTAAVEIFEDTEIDSNGKPIGDSNE